MNKNADIIKRKLNSLSSIFIASFKIVSGIYGIIFTFITLDKYLNFKSYSAIMAIPMMTSLGTISFVLTLILIYPMVMALKGISRIIINMITSRYK